MDREMLDRLAGVLDRIEQKLDGTVAEAKAEPSAPAEAEKSDEGSLMERLATLEALLKLSAAPAAQLNGINALKATRRGIVAQQETGKTSVEEQIDAVHASDLDPEKKLRRVLELRTVG